MSVKDLKVGAFTGPIQVPEGLSFFQRTTMTHYADAVQLMQAKQYQEALEHLDKDLALNPDRAHSLEFKASALQRLDRSPEAKTVYREILRQKPANMIAHINLALAPRKRQTRKRPAPWRKGGDTPSGQGPPEARPRLALD